jgi:hypothetical protein
VELRQWEREIRDATIHPDIRAGYERLRGLIDPKKHTELEHVPYSEQVWKARQLVAEAGGVLTQSVSRGHSWYAYRLEGKLKATDPCSTCQVAHDVKELKIPAQPTAPIDKRWNRDDPVQCAEASVCSQLYDANQYSFNSKRAIGLTSIVRCRIFNKARSGAVNSRPFVGSMIFITVGKSSIVVFRCEAYLRQFHLNILCTVQIHHLLG